MAELTRPQFRLRTVFAYTLVIAFGLAVLARARFVDADNVVAIGMVFLLPMLTLPSLLERSIDSKMPLRFGPLMGVFQLIAVSLYSSVALVLSTLAFAPVWKGSKGLNWIFYVNDGLAAAVLYPIYFGGALAFGYAILKPSLAVKSPFAMAAIAFNAAISLMYVFYVLVMRYVTGEIEAQRLFVIVPGNAAWAYALMAIALWRRREFTANREAWVSLYVWCGCFLGTMMAKIPLAVMLFRSLPDEPPDQCFIVTAASRGHRGIVGTFYDTNLNRNVNGQLIRFWEFERLLIEQCPRFHRLLRRVYNRLGPLLAATIVTRWQADVVYILLKPVELLAVLMVRVRGI